MRKNLLFLCVCSVFCLLGWGSLLNELGTLTGNVPHSANHIPQSVAVAGPTMLIPPAMHEILIGPGALSRWGGGGSSMGVNVASVGNSASLIAAVTSASSGDVIWVQPGTYEVVDLLIPSGVSLVGVSRDRCKLQNTTTDVTPTIVLAGNNTIAHLDIAGFEGVTAPAAAIDMENTASPIEIVDCRIGCGVDGIYTQASAFCTGSGTIAVRRCVFYNPIWDIIRIECAQAFTGKVIIEDNELMDDFADNATNRLGMIVGIRPGGGEAYISRNRVDTKTYGPAPNILSSWIYVFNESSGTAGPVRCEANRVRIEEQDSEDIAGILMVAGTVTSQVESFNDQIELSGGGDEYGFWSVHTGANPYVLTTVGTGSYTAKQSKVGVISSDYPSAIQQVVQVAGYPQEFAVAARAFDGFDWNATTKQINRTSRNAFVQYTARTADKLVVTAGTGMSVPKIGTVVSKLHSSVTVTEDGGAGDWGATITDDSVAGHFLTRDVDFRKGTTALIAMDEDFTLHAAGFLETTGETRTMTFTGHASNNYVVTWGTTATSGLEVTGDATMTVNANTTSIVTWISNGTKFCEVARVEGLTP